MSTLLIEGGRLLSGRITVEGNKNAALPLLAACLLTDQPCELTNVPRIADVGVMAELLVGLGAEVEGIGTTTLRDPLSARRDGHAGSGPGRPPARIGAADGAAAGAPRPRALRRRRAATFRRAARSRRTCEALTALGRARAAGESATELDAPNGLKAGVLLSGRGVGDGDGGGAARAAAARRASPRSATRRASRTSRSCASS